MVRCMPSISFRLKPKFRSQNSGLKKPSPDDFGRTIACVFDDGATSLGCSAYTWRDDLQVVRQQRRRIGGSKARAIVPS